jgi:hypothetical protein
MEINAYMQLRETYKDFVLNKFEHLYKNSIFYIEKEPILIYSSIPLKNLSGNFATTKNFLTSTITEEVDDGFESINCYKKAYFNLKIFNDIKVNKTNNIFDSMFYSYISTNDKIKIINDIINKNNYIIIKYILWENIKNNFDIFEFYSLSKKTTLTKIITTENDESTIKLSNEYIDFFDNIFINLDYNFLGIIFNKFENEMKSIIGEVIIEKLDVVNKNINKIIEKIENYRKDLNAKI